MLIFLSLEIKKGGNVCKFMKQISIFDILEEQEDYSDFKEMSSEQIANFIGKKTGLCFKPDKQMPGYYCVIIKKVEFRVGKVAFLPGIYEGAPFISCDVNRHFGDHYGKSVPIDSLEEAVKWFIEQKTYFLKGKEQ